MVTDEKTLEVTGTLNPDVTGIYNDDGEYNGKRSYQLDGDGFFLWWNGIATWYLSVGKGLLIGARWSRTDPSIEGDYGPIIPATGVATVTEI